MARKIIKLCLFSIGLFVLIELTYRFFVLGPMALNPVKMRSFTTLLTSGFVQPADELSVYFELKPNLDGLLRGVPIRTNSRGLADREYAIEKGPDTYRIAVVGSSWTMPASATLEEAYHTVLEEELNTRHPESSIEVINFGVEQYGLGEIVATVEHKVLAYEPDLIIVAITPFTSRIPWVERDEPFDPPEKADPLLRSWVLMQLGIVAPVDDEFQRSLDRQKDIRSIAEQQLESAFEALHGITSKGDTEVLVLWLAFFHWSEAIQQIVAQYTDEFGFDLIYGPDLLIRPEGGYQVSSADRHPNASGHAAIAMGLLQKLEQRVNRQSGSTAADTASDRVQSEPLTPL